MHSRCSTLAIIRGSCSQMSSMTSLDASSGFRPLDYLTGNCGDAFIFVYSSGFGEAEFSIGVDANDADLLSVEWHVYWQNDRTGGSNTVSGIDSASGAHWSKLVPYYTNWGTVHAHFYGYADFPFYSCSIGSGNEPGVSAFISPSYSPSP